MVHLHTRSAYSLLESPFRIEQIVDMAIKYGFNHACLTDKRSMYGTMKFIKLCQEKGNSGISLFVLSGNIWQTGCNRSNFGK